MFSSLNKQLALYFFFLFTAAKGILILRQEELMDSRSEKLELRARCNKNFWDEDGDEILDL
jgi:hypothetical protein